jgi:ABC-type transport system involved in multi-copper enzyme maturation permease subunit
MSSILKCDLYRFGKSKLLYGIVVFTAFIAVILVILIRQDIRIGISVFGDLTAFKGIDDIVRAGVRYHNGLGIFVAILLSGFIGQEYQWKTWQHKWMINKSRAHIYLSKAVFSSTGSAAIFLIYQTFALVGSGQIQDMLTGAYIATVISGLFIYAALGAVICLLSMLIKNSTASMIVCLLYVLLGETLASVMSNIGSISATVGRFVEFGIRHSVYGMSTIVSSTAFSIEHIMPIITNSFIIMIFCTVFGLIVFRKYEL